MSDDEKGYNGWKNYETWDVALWIGNDSETDLLAQDMARDAGSVGELAESLKQWQQEEMPDLGASVWSDLLSAALSEVDWYEIAEHYFDEVHEEAEAE
jgi:hypothetical protein